MTKIVHNSYETLDDIMNDVFHDLLELPFDVNATRGVSSEIIGTTLHLKNPRARLSRTETKGKAFSALGELLWYLSKSDSLEFIKHYIPQYTKDSEDGLTIYGAYGPRLFKLRGKIDQIANIIKLLEAKPTSRKAVIQIFDGEDIDAVHSEIPCTCTLQFFIRDSKLHMHATMRSNDAFKGLPHDIFAFTMLQEIMARKLGVELGEYYHSVGSLHLYKDQEVHAQRYLKEGYQSTLNAMPLMPKGDPMPSIDILLDVEARSRAGKEINFAELKLDPYWTDLAKLIKIHSLVVEEKIDDIVNIKESISPLYKVYIEQRLVSLQSKLDKI